MKILKISESVYTASFSHQHPSYLQGFPQRETYLFANNPDIDVVWHRHRSLNNADSIHLQPAYANKFGHGALPIAERAATRVVSLPLHPYLDESDQERVIAAVKNAIRKY